jgi:hypothetical protein
MYTLQNPLAQLVEQKPAVQAFDMARRFAASLGAADSATARAATAPATRNFVVSFVIFKGSPFD